MFVHTCKMLMYQVGIVMERAGEGHRYGNLDPKGLPKLPIALARSRDRTRGSIGFAHFGTRRI